MMGLFEAAWVIARRDFLATVYSRTFIIFLLMPVFLVGISLAAGQAGERADREAQQAEVALVTDSQTVAALQQGRQALVAGTSELSFPRLTVVAPAEHPDVQAQGLLADESAAYSAVFTGTLDHPVLTGPAKIDDYVGRRMTLILDQARARTALSGAHVVLPAPQFRRVLTAEAAGNLHSTRHFMARAAQFIVFTITLLLATMMVTNLIEEKSNKVIEVLAASVPLDSVFFGKLVAWLGVSLLGMALVDDRSRHPLPVHPCPRSLGGDHLGGARNRLADLHPARLALFHLQLHAARRDLPQRRRPGEQREGDPDHLDADHDPAGHVPAARGHCGQRDRRPIVLDRLHLPVELAIGDVGARHAVRIALAASGRARLAVPLGRDLRAGGGGDVPPDGDEIGRESLALPGASGEGLSGHAQAGAGPFCCQSSSLIPSQSRIQAKLP